MDGLSIDVINGDLIKQELRNIIQKRTNSSNIQLCMEHGSTTGDNFLGQIYRILFKSVSDDKHNKATSLILKMAPQNILRREITNIRALFLTEIEIYRTMLSFFTEFQLSKGINPDENGFIEYPKCYHTISEPMSECLFLEDLKLRNFEMVNLREEELTFDHMSLILRSLGKFHAISLALKNQQSEKFKRFSELADEKFWNTIPGVKNHVEYLISSLKNSNRFDLYKKANRAIGSDASAAIKNLLLSTKSDKYAVICHGDITTKNTMFRKNENGKPIEVRLFDWQLTRVASPVIDLITYLICFATKELRDRHYDEFLQIYHESLSDMLKRLGSDPTKTFPYESFLDQVKKYGAYAIYVAAYALPMYFSAVDFIPNFDDLETMNLNEAIIGVDIYRFPDDLKVAYDKKITDMFDDMARFGYI